MAILHPMIATPEFLRQAPEAVRREFAQEAHPFTFPEGRQILIPGQRCTGMAFVFTGCVRVYLLGQDGREITLYRVEPGQGCVLTAACLLGGTGFPAFAVIERDSAGSSIPADRFRAWVAREVFWREFVFRMIGERMTTVLARFEEAAFDRFETRLARLLLRRLNAGGVLVTATHQQLADELGSAREVVSRALERWQSAGCVRLHRGSVEILKPGEIQHVAGPS